MERLIAIVGPTAAGKSRLALRLAPELDGEILSADSRQMYRYMDIGTAKPGREERALVPHHLIDILNPDEDFSLAQYQQLAYHTIVDIHQRGKLPWLVGGSGLYVWAVLGGWSIPPVPPDPALRRTLAERAAKGEVAELYQELMALDPVAAQKIDPRNVRRVIRALEVTRSAGVPFSQLQQKKAPPFQTLIIGLTADRAELYRRIDLRVDEMITKGLVEEVKKLVNMGYGFNLPAMSGIGYRQIGLYLRGELSLAEAIQQIKYETHRFARHQYNWFRLNDSRIQWFDIKDEVDSKVIKQVSQFMTA
ncbi:MAG: tRNA (adenosine(37)-N6)-dimethylallyltransferase MiaA [Dehalococcoidales bacterium]|nr:tRNA (adenosine(37)-N6)-dimethylallyltransferase MiaA [Dehalococcoidales bacterium]